MVWIHGGAYTIGSGDLYDGRHLARRGDVVVVTINYRLGVLGWLALDHLDSSLAGSGNNGIRDQIEALRWVRDNISSFGGDPGNVTLFGESAGGGSIGALLGAPDADGLYHKAIIQSGPVAIAPLYKPEFFADALLDALDSAGGGIDAFRRADPAQLVQAQVDVGSLEQFGRDRDHAIDGSGIGLRPSVDGVVVHASPLEVVTARGSANVPLLIGTNLDEGTLFLLLLPTDITDDELLAALPETVTDRAAIAESYAARTTGRRLVVDLMTDTVFLVPALRLADAQAATGAPVWTYLFTWPTPVFGGLLGATHALELPFVWGQIEDPAWQAFVGDDPPAALAGAMQEAWLAFAHTGDPNVAGAVPWPRYDLATRRTLEFGETVRVVDDPSKERRELWFRAAPVA
jgi:para-nitrobenzyl esterase